MRWLKVIGVNEDKHSGENLVNEGVVLLSEEERILKILSVIKLRYSSGEKEPKNSKWPNKYSQMWFRFCLNKILK